MKYLTQTYLTCLFNDDKNIFPNPLIIFIETGKILEHDVQSYPACSLILDAKPKDSYIKITCTNG